MQIPLADKSVHCVVTSPPYWGLRKYAGVQSTFWSVSAECEIDECAYGLEPTIEKYVEHSLVILREVRRVLRDDGTCWWNLGDSYAASGMGGNPAESEHRKQATNAGSLIHGHRPPNGLKSLDLCLIPERVALAAQADGWYVRSLVIWTKPNPMPESVNGWRWERHRMKVEAGKTGRTTIEKPGYSLPESEAPDFTRPHSVAQWADCPGCEKCSPNDGLVLRKGSWRPTDAYEHILMLTKSDNYFGDAEAVKEAQSVTTFERYASNPMVNTGNKYEGLAGHSKAAMKSHNGGFKWAISPSGTRNLRNFWDFTTEPNTLTECAACHFVYDSKRNLPWKWIEAENGKRKIYQCVQCRAWDQWCEHFATFPERLPEICIKASTSERGCCRKCGANWVRVIEIDDPNGRLGKGYHDHQGDLERGQRGVFDAAGAPTRKTTGWRPSCSCNAGEPVPCTVLDPFGGSGTTARVALRLNRRAVSLDLAYHGLARKRTTEVQPELMGVL